MCTGGPQQIPVEIVFNPNWWYSNYGISFDRPFYFDRDSRIANDVKMRKILYERFGVGEPDPQPRPVIGSRHVAGGFVVPALLGAEVRFADNQAPWVVAGNLSREQILTLEVPEIERTWPMSELLAQMEALEREFGHLVGDLNAGGVLNVGLDLRGNQLFLDLLEDPELTTHLFEVIAETIARVAEGVKARSGTCSVSCNRNIVHSDEATFVHANCSAPMISPALFEKTLLPYERRLAERLRPYGIHHCGENLHKFAALYAQTGACFYDVGWGSDVARCAELLPEAFLSLRLSSVRVLQGTAQEVRRDTEKLLTGAGRTANVAICCVNMDYGTPDENVRAIFEAAAGW
jgi:uroporphyrinogen-III decarboxylase